MEMKLFLSKINQEMIDTGRKLTKEAKIKCDFYVSWKKSCCVLDFFIQNPDDVLTLPMRNGLLMRKEDVGGLLWDPKTGAVYQVDEEAYHALLDLDQGISETEVARRMGVPMKSLRALTTRLKKFSQ